MSQNTVELIGFYGSDETHAMSAWTSTRREIDDERRARMHLLLKQLASDGHHTPFEKSALHFLLHVETASHIHIIKHRIAVAVNAASARYRELKGDSYYEPLDWPEEIRTVYREHMVKTYALYHQLMVMLQDAGISRKRAKESARFVLPYANQTTMDVMFNFRSFMHFQKLRNEDHAQDEIHWVAQGLLDRVRETGAFTHSLEAFGW